MGLLNALKGILPSKNGASDQEELEPCIGSYDDDDYDDSEALSVWDAADIWMCSGMDEDCMFGYSAEELRNAM